MRLYYKHAVLTGLVCTVAAYCSCAVLLLPAVNLFSASGAGIDMVVLAFVSLLAGFVAFGIIVSRGRRRERQQAPICSKCGYLLLGLTDSRCPECGKPFDPKLLDETGEKPNSRQHN